MNTENKNAPQDKGTISVGAKSFITAIVVIFGLMVATYILTLTIPGGKYLRYEDEAGNLIINTEAGFSFTYGGLPFWKWLLSPILVLTASGSGSLIAVIIFLLVIGGVFTALDRCGLIKYMLELLTHRFGAVRYRLMAVLIFFFMALGAVIGSFEEVVPLVPIVVALAIKLGWDAPVGISMSVLAAGCGFASGVCNPFTVGVAQELAGLPMFSGAWFRLLAFVLIYCLLFGFTYFYSKKIERSYDSTESSNFVSDPKLSRALICFGSIIGFGILLVICSGFISALQDYTMIIVAVTFLIGGVCASLISGMGVKVMSIASMRGMVTMLPAVVMILMASSIKYTLEEAKTLDTLLYYSVKVAEVLPSFAVILFIYLIVLVMNFFIPSGSAKAFMLIPLIVPLAQIFGISTQLCIVAFAFGDGFSNVFYPTNPALLISLGLAETSYGQWVKWSWKFQLSNLLLTSSVLIFGLAVGY